MIERIYKQYKPFLLRFLSRYVSHEDAEDIVQEVFLRYITNQRQQPILNVGVWLVNVARHLLIDRSRRKRELHADNQAIRNEVAKVLLDTIADESWSADYELHREEIGSAIRRALEQLPPAQRYVIEMTEIEGKSFKELTLEVDTPINTLLTRKHKGIHSLRKKLKRLMLF